MSDSSDYLAWLFFIGIFCAILFFSISILTLPYQVDTLEEVNPIFHSLYRNSASLTKTFYQIYHDSLFYFSIALSVTLSTILFVIGSFIRDHSKIASYVDRAGSKAGIMGFSSLFGWYLLFTRVGPYSYSLGEIFFVSIIAAILTGVIAGSIVHYLSTTPSQHPRIDQLDLTSSDDDTLDIYTPIDSLKQLDSVTPIYNIEEVGKYAECPYCGSNIRDTFYELGGIVRCDKCGAFHHKECFEYYGKNPHSADLYMIYFKI